MRSKKKSVDRVVHVLLLRSDVGTAKGVDPIRKWGGRHTCEPREKFWRAKRGATERSEPTSEGGSGGPPPKNFKNLHGKWCNLRYS